MPTVSEQFKTYREFASASLTDIYGSRLADAYKVTANHLESGVWINETSSGSSPKFSWISFPWEGQLSPVNDVAVGDFNGNGKMELILAQNHFTNQVETGLWRGSPGCHLEWREGGFSVIPYNESGVLLVNDTKGILPIDVDGDGHLDILAAQNNDKLLLFENTKKGK